MGTCATLRNSLLELIHFELNRLCVPSHLPAFEKQYERATIKLYLRRIESPAFAMFSTNMQFDFANIKNHKLFAFSNKNRAYSIYVWRARRMCSFLQSRITSPVIYIFRCSPISQYLNYTFQYVTLPFSLKNSESVRKMRY